MSLSVDQLQLLSQWFDEVVDLAPGDREAWLARQGGEHEALIHHLRQMLSERGSTRSQGFLDVLPQLVDAPDHDVLPNVARPGERVGPYQLVREIGRGGMGAVWLADRADGVFKRQVALKLPRLAWGAGLAERMARERDIGAKLEHPHIARLYDAGVDERGRPYMALEHIDGLAIDHYCRQHELPVRDRLLLLVQVARAVAYAHGRLVVHRDLKPGNVLVSEDGQAHLLDFGIAKLLDDASERQPALTQEHASLLTPRYASPEQLQGAAITVQTDVYGLGLLAFEVLSGALPYKAVGDTPVARRALQTQIERGIQRLASEQAANLQIQRQLRGDLDAVLAKALKADPRERYRSADALADDLQCWLDNKPVSAQPDGVLYRWKKAAQRHWVGLGAALAVLAAGLAVAGSWVVSQQRAEQAASRERLITEFVSEVFHINQRSAASATHSGAAVGLQGDAFLRATAPIIERRFAHEPAMQARLYGVVAKLFHESGMTDPALDFSVKHSHALKALRHSPLETVEARLLEVEALFNVRRFVASEDLAREVLAIPSLGLGDRARAVELLARNQYWLARVKEAEATLDALDGLALQIAKPTLAQAHGFGLRGSIMSSQSRFADAKAWFQRGIDMAEAVEGPDSATAASVRILFGEQLARNGAPVAEAKAKAMLAAGLDAQRRKGGLVAVTSDVRRTFFWRFLFNLRGVSFSELQQVAKQAQMSVAANPATSDAVRRLLDYHAMMAWVRWGDLERVWPHYLPTVEAHVPLMGSPLRSQIGVLTETQRVLMVRGEHIRAQAWGLRAQAMREKMGEGKHAAMAHHWIAQAYNLSMAGRTQEAMASLLPLDNSAEWPTVASDPRVRRQREQVRIHLLADAGQIEAAALHLKALPASKPSGNIAFDSPEVLRARVDCQTGRAPQGLEAFERLLALGTPDRYPHSPEFAWVRGHMALCALKLNDRTRAKAFADQAAESFRVQPQVSAYFKRPLAEYGRMVAVPKALPAKP